MQKYGRRWVHSFLEVDWVNFDPEWALMELIMLFRYSMLWMNSLHVFANFQSITCLYSIAMIFLHFLYFIVFIAVNCMQNSDNSDD